ncbi:Hypothetical protein AA314_00946 [Archangium gephyra]|uniref:Uncharacterized protein n=1 Tax=Archangium gephyra TaxID=48 RepID=A0AAC8Q1K7_9BACT|nr:Hypothetical protein AA314_00946 [Archangium gephyra]
MQVHTTPSTPAHAASSGAIPYKIRGTGHAPRATRYTDIAVNPLTACLP